jgi:uncharacterized protein (DUF2235 family)
MTWIVPIVAAAFVLGCAVSTAMWYPLCKANRERADKFMRWFHEEATNSKG